MVYSLRKSCQQAAFCIRARVAKNANKPFLYQGTSLLVPQRAQTESGALAPEASSAVRATLSATCFSRF
jgi:hypothetical protein